MKDTMRVSLNLTRPPKGTLGGFHMEVCKATTKDGTVVEVSSGYGCGHTDLYVARDGKRVLVVDTEPMLRALIELVLDEEEAP